MSATSEDLHTDLPTDSLIKAYDGVICDLDGVVYRGRDAVPGAVETLNEVVAGGVEMVFATNNASRPPEDVAEHLRELGVGGQDWSVVTSSQSAAAYLAEQLRPGAPVLAVGGPGVALALAKVGLVPVRVPELDDIAVEAIVQGLGVDVTWRELAEVGYLAQRGLPWVATNLDLFLPTGPGPAPGNGALVAAVRTTTTRMPHVTGKPGAALFDLARTRMGTDQPRTLACGDRLDTDIAGANAAQLDSLLVLSGASTLHDLALAPEHERPTYVAHDLTGLLEPALRLDGGADDRVAITLDGQVQVRAEDTPDRLVRSVVTSVWAARDAGHPVSDDAEMWGALGLQIGLTAPDSNADKQSMRAHIWVTRTWAPSPKARGDPLSHSRRRELDVDGLCSNSSGGSVYRQLQDARNRPSRWLPHELARSLGLSVGSSDCW